jgi:hypothetical protein
MRSIQYCPQMSNSWILSKEACDVLTHYKISPQFCNRFTIDSHQDTVSWNIYNRYLKTSTLDVQNRSRSMLNYRLFNLSSYLTENTVSMLKLTRSDRTQTYGCLRIGVTWLITLARGGGHLPPLTPHPSYAYGSSRVKYLLFLAYINQNRNVWTNFSKNSKYELFTKFRPVEESLRTM